MNKDILPQSFNRHYFELDLLRALAIIMVMLRHFYDHIVLQSLPNFLMKFMVLGWHGVDLFFALSGFLIGGQIIEECINGKFSFRRFYIKRFWRIFPPYYFSLFMLITFESIHAKDFVLKHIDVLKETIVHAVYLQNYIRYSEYESFSPYWTLAIEEHFYIVVPVILYLFIRYAKKYLFTGLILLIIFGISIRFMLYYYLSEESLDVGKWTVAFAFPSHLRFYDLLFGVVVAYIYISYRDKLQNISYVGRGLFILIPVVSLGIAFYYGTLSPGYFNTCWQFVLTGLGFSVLVLYAVLFPISKYIPLPFKRIFELIAKYSYTMYLYHMLILFLLIFSFSLLNFSNHLVMFIIYLIATILISAVFYWLIDRPSMRYRNKILKVPGR